MRAFVPVLSAAVVCGLISSSAAVDQIYVNGKVFTANTDRPQVSAFAVEGATISHVGSDEEIRALVSEKTTVIDLAGRRVMPGLIDSHSHSIFGGIQLSSADMDDEEVDLKELEKRLIGWRNDGKALKEDVLVVTGMHSSYWSKADDMDRMFNQGEWAKVPVAFLGSDYHTAWANRIVLARAKIDKAYVDALPEEQKQTVGVTKDGEPNGLLVDAGWDRANAIMPKPTEEGLLQAARAAVAYNNALGITAWMDPAANASPGEGLFSLQPTEKSYGILPAYKALADKGELTAHVAALLVAPATAKPGDLDVLDKVRQHFSGTPNMTFPGIKVFADGVLEFPAQSAALLGHYHNSEKPGELLIDPAHFGELVSAADQRGWIVHVHAIGDRAVRETLNAFEFARKQTDSGISHSITHLQLVHPDDFPRFKALNVIASMQLIWATADGYTVDLIKPYLDESIFRYQYPAESLLKAGATLAGASDWPISPPSPWEAIYQAVTRVGPGGVLGEAERVNREAMFYAYTINAARTIGLAERIGTLEKGKQADFIVLDRDVFEVSDADLKGTKVLETYFGGKKVSR